MKVHARIQKWGNGLALRVTKVMRDIPRFQEGTEIDIDICESGFTVTKCEPVKKALFPFTEAELLKGLTPELAHADLLATLSESEITHE